MEINSGKRNKWIAKNVHCLQREQVQMETSLLQ